MSGSEGRADRLKVLTYNDIDDTPVDLPLALWSIDFRALDNDTAGQEVGYVLKTGGKEFWFWITESSEQEVAQSQLHQISILRFGAPSRHYIGLPHQFTAATANQIEAAITTFFSGPDMIVWGLRQRRNGVRTVVQFNPGWIRLAPTVSSSCGGGML